MQKDITRISHFSEHRHYLPILRAEKWVLQGIWAPKGYVANFAQEVVKGQLPLSVEGLRGQGVEQFSRSEALGSLLNHQLPFLDHVHELNTSECPLGRVKRFES